MKIKHYKQNRRYIFKRIDYFLKNSKVKNKIKRQPKKDFIKNHILTRKVQLFSDYSENRSLFFDFKLFEENLNLNITLNDYLKKQNNNIIFCDFFSVEDFYFGILFFDKDLSGKDFNNWEYQFEKFFSDNASIFLIDKKETENKIFLTPPQMVCGDFYNTFVDFVESIYFSEHKVINPYFLKPNSFVEIKKYLKDFNSNEQLAWFFQRELEKVEEQKSIIQDEENEFLKNFTKNILTNIKNLSIKQSEIKELIFSKLKQ